MPFDMASFGIELYQIACYIFDAFLGSFFESVPCSGA